jgi:hypothetical protein
MLERKHFILELRDSAEAFVSLVEVVQNLVLVLLDSVLDRLDFTQG